jgi:hypothetical protein
VIGHFLAAGVARNRLGSSAWGDRLDYDDGAVEGVATLATLQLRSRFHVAHRP